MSEQPQVLVIGPDGRPMAAEAPVAGEPAGEESPIAAMVSSPDKVMRIGTMIKQLLEEVKAAPLDEASRRRLKEIQQRSVTELADGLSEDLRHELGRITLPFADDDVPSDAELRIAQAQLVGWLEGLFHGIQTTLVAQQMAARAQLEQMRGRALPRGSGMDGAPGSGQYL